ncbi:MAG: hypothetical protein WD579_00400 [Candidatus Paceibacterota bacterium]
MEQENNKGLIIGVVVIIILAVLFLLFGGSAPENTGTDDDVIEETESASEGITEVDLDTAEGLDRFPEGFPTDVPVEPATIVNSVNLERNDGGSDAIIIYRPDASVNEVYDAFVSYMTDAGYTIETDSLDGMRIDLQGTSADGELTVSSMELEGEGILEVFVNFVGV